MRFEALEFSGDGEQKMPKNTKKYKSRGSTFRGLAEKYFSVTGKFYQLLEFCPILYLYNFFEYNDWLIKKKIIRKDF